jgi:hypothetical protein
VAWRFKAVAEWIDAAIVRQRCGKHANMAADTDTTIEDMVFSVHSVPTLYNKDQLDKPPSRQSVWGQSWQLAALSCIVGSSYLATISDQTKDFMCAVV